MCLWGYRGDWIEGYLDFRIRRRIIKEVAFSLGPNGNVKRGTMGHCGSRTIRSKVPEYENVMYIIWEEHGVLIF